MKGRCARQASIYCLCCSCMCCICYRRACYCTVSCYKLSLPWADGVKGCCARQASIYCLCCNCMCCICCRRACYCTVSCYKLSLPWADGVKAAVQDRPVYSVSAVTVCAVFVIGESATVRLVAISYLYLELMVWRLLCKTGQYILSLL